MGACNYDESYKPLIYNWYQENLNNLEAFKTKLEGYFTNDAVNQILNMIESGIDLDSTPTFFSPIDTTSNSVDTYFFKDPFQGAIVKREFAKRIAETSLLKVTDNEVQWINPSEINNNGASTVNNIIRSYKVELLNKVLTYLKLDLVTEANSDKDLEVVYRSIESFNVNEPNSNLRNSDTYIDAYKSFVTLKCFDQLLAETSPFIKVDSRASHSIFNLNRYIYTGPTVNYDTSWGKSEHSDAIEKMGDLAKQILRVLPRANRNGQIIPDTSIGYQPFLSTMIKVKEWAQENGQWNDTKTNLSEVLSAYITAFSRNDIPARLRVSYPEVIYGIYNWIYANKTTPETLQQMFTRIVNNTVRASYCEYDGTSSKRGLKVRSTVLTERNINNQRLALEDSILGSILYLQKFPNEWKRLEKYNIPNTIDGAFTITINGKVLKFTDEGVLIDSGECSTEEFVTAFREITNIIIPNNFKEVGNGLGLLQKYSTISLFGPILGKIIYHAKNNTTNPKVEVPTTIARIYDSISGGETRSIIRNSEGNDLPVFTLPSLAHRFRDVYDRHSQTSENAPIRSNLIFNNISNLRSPIIRSAISVNSNTGKDWKTRTTSPEHFITSDVVRISLMNDFYERLNDQTSSEDVTSDTGWIGVQVHCFSDKNRHFIQMFNLNTNWIYYNESGVAVQINPREIINNYIDGKGDLKELTKMWRTSMRDSYTQIVNRIIADYATAFETIETVKTLDDVQRILNKYNADEIKRSFEGRVDFIEEFHGSGKSKLSLNQTLLYFLNITNDEATFQSFVSKMYNEFEKEVNYSPDPNDSDKSTRIKKAYFLIDNMLSNSFNEFMVGSVFFHPNKDKSSKQDLQEMAKLLGWDPEKLTDEDIEELKLRAEISSRWIAQIKRMVIYGATYQSFQQGMKYGVPENIKVAVISDLPATVRNMIGQSKEIDSMDGSGLVSPYMSLWENVSLIDAKVGSTKKTIYGDVDGETMKPTLLKWAEYSITNAWRRLSWNSDVSINDLFRRMHTIPFDENVNINYEKTFDNFYIKSDPYGEYRKVESINIVNNIAHILYEGSMEPDEITIRDIDTLARIFGGCWCAHKNDMGQLVEDESSIEYVNEIICEYNLKDYVIAFLANKSATKVGAANVNPSSIWMAPYNADSKSLRYMTMSTRFGGVQMDADHHLDDSDVSEMTQMLSALVQMGYTHSLVEQIYQDISASVDFALADYMGPDVDEEQLRKIFTRALIETFTSNDRETLGLAQAFIKNAQKQGLNIPFSSNSINGIFNSTVTVDLIKRAIRRHYDGIGAVLHPGYGSIQYYNYDGKYMTFPQIIPIVKQQMVGTIFEGDNLDEFFKSAYVEKDGKRYDNPFVVQIEHDEIAPEDLIYVKKDGLLQAVKINNIHDYIYYRQYYTGEIYRNKLTPRNLQSTTVKFKLTDNNGNIKSLTADETPYAYLLSLIAELNFNDRNGANINDFVLNEFRKTFKEKFNIDPQDYPEFNDIISTISNLPNDNLNNVEIYLKRRQQEVLNNLVNGNQIDLYETGELSSISDVEVKAAEIAMGRRNMRQLDLRETDNLSDIDVNFYRERIGSYYKEGSVDKNAYDYILFDGAGNKIYVKLGHSSIDTLTPNSNYLNIDGNIYVNDKKLCSADGKAFYTITDAEGNPQTLCVVNNLERLRELQKSKFKVTRYNYREDNKQQLFDTLPENARKIREDKTIDQLNQMEYRRIATIVQEHAELKFAAFQKQLNLIGVRIPCQGMTSFAPMRIAMFVDTDINAVYVPTTITWLQGSDFDIDKQYLLGHSVSDAGEIVTLAENEWERDSAIKNKTVDGVWSVITSPKNQINLSAPVTTDDVQDIAKKSKSGTRSKLMGPFNPVSRYTMQIENMFGKQVIGIDATAIKSFFAATAMTNKAVEQLVQAILQSDNDLISQLLQAYTIKYTGLDGTPNEVCIANTNLDKIKELSKNSDIWNKIDAVNQKRLSSIIDSEKLQDVSLLLGELLNSATDNAKELTLKKINSDTTWADIYCLLLMFGEDLDKIADLMIDPNLDPILNDYLQSAFDVKTNADKEEYFAQILTLDEITFSQRYGTQLTPNLKRKIEYLRYISKIAKDLRILGSMLKINQGVPTNFFDATLYVQTINRYINDTYGTPSQDNTDFFDYYRFLSDEVYAQRWIEQCDRTRGFINILRVVNEVPHFKSMSRALVANKHILTTLSIKNKLLDAVLSVAARSKKFNRDAAETYKERIDELLVGKWIETLGISIKLPANTPYVQNNSQRWTTEESSFLVDGKNLGILRTYIETVIFPYLKTEYPNNEFVKHLTFATSNGTPVYRLNIDMMTVDNSTQSQKIYGDILNGFGEICGIDYGGQSIGDWLYLYNLLLYNDRFGAKTFTRIFERMVDNNDKALIYQFNNWIDQQSDNVETWVSEITHMKHNLPSQSDYEFTMGGEVIFQGQTYHIYGDRVYTQNKLEVTEPHLKNKILILSERKSGKARGINYEGKPYVVLSNNRIIDADGYEVLDSQTKLNILKNLPTATLIPNRNVSDSNAESQSTDIRISYTPPGGTKQEYIVRGDQIINKDGKEVYKDDNKHRRKILGKRDIILKNACIVTISQKSGDTIEDHKYIVYTDGRILSQSGNFMKWDEDNGLRKEILQKAKERFGEIRADNSDLMFQRRTWDVIQNRQFLREHYLPHMPKFVRESVAARESLRTVIAQTYFPYIAITKDRVKKEVQSTLEYINQKLGRHLIGGWVVDKGTAFALKLTLATEKDYERQYIRYIEGYIEAMSDQEVLSEVQRLQFDEAFYHIKKKDLETVRAQINANNDSLLKEEITEAIAWMVELENEPETNLYVKTLIKWLKNNAIRLPADHIWLRQLFDAARQEKLDVQHFSTPGALVQALDDINDKNYVSKPINPHLISEFKYLRTEEINGEQIEVFEVPNNIDARNRVSQVLADTMPKNKHGELKPGYKNSPWCTFTFNYHPSDGSVTRTTSAEDHHQHYGITVYQLAFYNGLPCACFDGKQWWSFKDSPSNQITVVREREPDVDTMVKAGPFRYYPDRDCWVYILSDDLYISIINDTAFDHKCVDEMLRKYRKISSQFKSGYLSVIDCVNELLPVEDEIVSRIKNFQIPSVDAMNRYRKFWEAWDAWLEVIYTYEGLLPINATVDVTPVTPTVMETMVDAIAQEDANILPNIDAAPIGNETTTNEYEPNREYLSEPELEEIGKTVRKNQPSLSNKSINKLLNWFKNEDLKTRYNAATKQQVNKELEGILKDILQHYHVEFIEGDLKAVFGEDVLGTTDFINKVIYLAEEGDRNALTGIEEFSHQFIKLMGAIYHKPKNRNKYPETKLYSELRDAIESTELYTQVVTEYSVLPQYKYSDGNINYPKLKEEALGKALATVILERYEQRKDKSFFAKVKLWFNDKLNWFKSYFKSSAYLDHKLAKIADSILNNTYHKQFIEKFDSSDYKLWSYAETLKFASEKDGGRALKILQDCVNIGGIVTGSLSYRAQTNVYRKDEDTLHDIDIVIPIRNHNWFDIHPNWRYLRPGAKNALSQEKLISDVMNVPAITELRNSQPNFDIIAVYANYNDGVVINGIICDNPELIRRFKEMSGNFNSRLQQFTETERDQIYLIDIFLDKDNSVEDYCQIDIENELKLAHYSGSFKAKLKYGRAKDLFDYQQLNPTNRKYQINYQHYIETGELIPIQSEEDLLFQVDNTTIGFKDDNVNEHVADAEPEIVNSNNYRKESTKVVNILHFSNKYPDLVQIITTGDPEWEKLDICERDARAFIKNGKIYVNFGNGANDADLYHELGHFYLAKVKSDMGYEYYSLLDKLYQLDRFKQIAANPYYQNKKTSDLGEEVLAHLITDYYSGRLDSNSVEFNLIKELDNIYSLDILDEMVSGESDFRSFVDFDYTAQQQIATLKNHLFNTGAIKENCN